MSRRSSLAGAGALVLGSIAVGTWGFGANAPDATTPVDGEQLFTVKGCAACHVGPDSTAAFGSAFPRLDDAAEWAGDRQTGVNAADYLAQSMVAPDAFRSPVFGSNGPAPSMPVLSLTSEEVDRLVAYLLEA